MKQAQAALRAAMDEVLHPLDLTVSQYVCLALIGERPGSSTADLARGAFVSRQAHHLVVRTLQDRRLLTRPATPPVARRLPVELTPAGQRLLAAADAAVSEVEARMVSPLDAGQQRQLLGELAAWARALRP